MSRIKAVLGERSRAKAAIVADARAAAVAEIRAGAAHPAAPSPPH